MRQIRSRIRTAKNIQQITKAMKMVAAARLKRAQDRVQAARPYSEKMLEVMRSLSRAAGSGGALTHPLLEVRPNVERVGVLAITADRGLCGSYASNILRRANDTARPFEPAQVQLLVAGRKGVTFFRRRPYPIAGEFSMNMTGVAFSEAQAVSQQAQQMYINGEIDALYLVYTRFISALVQRPTVVNLLPIQTEDAVDTAGADEGAGGEYLFEPDAESILNRLVPRFVDTLIYQAMQEAVASEHGARMTAMSSATDNAGKMISNLTLQANRARQANITKEIAEIVGGADALRNE
jgi:F-type H+-transporting ATPase subunit gamma